MFADILGFPVETVTSNETGALGCAIAAATAVGEYPSLEEAAKSMSVVGERIEPDARASEAYLRRYELYKKVIASLDDVWDDMQACIEGR